MSVQLPLPTPRAVPPRDLFSTLSILCIGPGRLVRDVVRPGLKAMGAAAVWHAPSVPQALAAVRSCKPDAILIEQSVLPAGDLGVSADLRRGVGCPLIMLSEASDWESIRQALDAGVDDCLIAPFALDFLKQRLLRAMHRQTFGRGYRPTAAA